MVSLVVKGVLNFGCAWDGNYGKGRWMEVQEYENGLTI
jgi:hypothetical protein